MNLNRRSSESDLLVDAHPPSNHFNFATEPRKELFSYTRSKTPSDENLTREQLLYMIHSLQMKLFALQNNNEYPQQQKMLITQRLEVQLQEAQQVYEYNFSTTFSVPQNQSSPNLLQTAAAPFPQPVETIQTPLLSNNTANSRSMVHTESSTVPAPSTGIALNDKLEPVELSSSGTTIPPLDLEGMSSRQIERKSSILDVFKSTRSSKVSPHKEEEQQSSRKETGTGMAALTSRKWRKLVIEKVLSSMRKSVRKPTEEDEKMELRTLLYKFKQQKKLTPEEKEKMEYLMKKLQKKVSQ